MGKKITIKRGEGRWIRFAVTQDGAVMNVSAYTFSFGVKTTAEAPEYTIKKEHADFDLDQAASGIVLINLTPNETAALEAQNYEAELQMIITPSIEVVKSDTITLTILPRVIV